MLEYFLIFVLLSCRPLSGDALRADTRKPHCEIFADFLPEMLVSLVLVLQCHFDVSFSHVAAGAHPRAQGQASAAPLGAPEQFVTTCRPMRR